MTTYVEARDRLAALIHERFSADHPDLPLLWENTIKLDTNTVGDQFVRVSIAMLASKQSTIEFKPRRRVLGEVVFEFVFKEGMGSRKGLILRDYVESFLAHRLLPGVMTKTATPGQPWNKDGWAGTTFSVPFFFD